MVMQAREAKADATSPASNLAGNLTGSPSVLVQLNMWRVSESSPEGFPSAFLQVAYSSTIVTKPINRSHAMTALNKWLLTAAFALWATVVPVQALPATPAAAAAAKDTYTNATYR